MRIGEIAKVLARRHEVMLTDGGIQVPRPPLNQVAMLPLPRIRRERGKFIAIDTESEIAAVMRSRKKILREAIETLRPDFLLVEHYPFSRWFLGDEIESMITYSRAVNPGARALCSMRDIQRQTVVERSDTAFAREVTNRLRTQFNMILVHGDPTMISFEEQFPFVSSVGLPLVYTGIVSEKLSSAGSRLIEKHFDGTPFILVSVGGDDRTNLLEHALAAWRWLRDNGHLQGYKLVLCQGLSGSIQRSLEMISNYRDEVLLRPFSADFLSWLKAASLSISSAGYNTCANILETGARALLVPDPETADQVTRAMLLEQRRLASVLAPNILSVKRLADAMLESLATVPPPHNIALDGAERTCALIEKIAERGFQPGSAAYNTP